MCGRVEPSCSLPAVITGQKNVHNRIESALRLAKSAPFTMMTPAMQRPLHTLDGDIAASSPGYEASRGRGRVLTGRRPLAPRGRRPKRRAHSHSREEEKRKRKHTPVALHVAGSNADAAPTHEGTPVLVRVITYRAVTPPGRMHTKRVSPAVTRGERDDEKDNEEKKN